MLASPDRPQHVPLAVVTRSDRIESVHYGSIAVVENTGRLIYHLGDPQAMVFTRSACKPFQALPLIAREAVTRFGFTAQEIAVICASHSGEPRHLEAVLNILGKIGCSKADLQCGVHTPLYYEALGRQPRAEEVFTPLHHNCSGKHAGMLALCRLLGAPIENYLAQDHPVQKAILEAVARFSGAPRAQIGVGIDGCSAPNFALPLSALALGYARLANDAADAQYGQAPQIIFSAMTEHPEMVSGIKRLDLALMHTGQGDWVTKAGAEGIQGIGIRSRGWGLAVKIADGAARALPAVAIEVLCQLGLLPTPIDVALVPFGSPPITNSRGVNTGEVRPVFKLS